jgi:hypothetical protein
VLVTVFFGVLINIATAVDVSCGEFEDFGDAKGRRIES